jgi:hypothetical protein
MAEFGQQPPNGDGYEHRNERAGDDDEDEFNHSRHLLAGPRAISFRGSYLSSASCAVPAVHRLDRRRNISESGEAAR